MTKIQSVVTFVTALAIGYVLCANSGSSASAQVVSQTGAPRYQVSAYAYAGDPPSQSPKHGCYILDTVTGALWHSGPDSQRRPLKVSDKLP